MTTVSGSALRGALALATPGLAAGACSENLSLHGNPGTVIPEAKIQFVYWGSYWTDAGQGERSAYDQAWNDVGNNPAFYERLAEYSTPTQTIGAGAWIGSTLANGSLVSGVTITEDQIKQELAAELTAATIAPLVDGRIYVVMLPPGVTSQFDQQNGYAGHHREFPNPSGSGLPVVYVLITYSSSTGYNDPLIAHEVSESITDPDLSTGWYDSQGEEIGDPCRFDYTTLDGYPIEEIFSEKACACVGASTGTTDAGSPDTGTNSTTCMPDCSGKQCGDDGCGGSCGNCTSGQACSSAGACPSGVNQCGLFSPWDPNKPWVDYSVGEEHTASNDHLYSCKNVAYCIYDPTSYVGLTYGWTDLGPCG